MAIIHFDGFDDYAHNASTTQCRLNWDVFTSPFAGSAVYRNNAGRFGNGGLYYDQNSNSGWFAKLFTPRTTQITYAAFSANYSAFSGSTSANWGNCWLMSMGPSNGVSGGETQHVILRWKPSVAAQLQIVRVSAGPTYTELDVCDNPFLPNTWHHIEMALLAHASSGSVSVKVDGVEVMSYSGNTKGPGTAQVAAVTWFAQEANYVGTQMLDDTAIWDNAGDAPNSSLDDFAIVSVRAASNGTTVDGTPSSGSEYQCVDETFLHNSDTDYVTDTAENNINLFNFPDFPVADSVLAIKTTIVARGTEQGARWISPVVRTGGVNYVHDDQQIARAQIGYQSLQFYWPVNPSDDDPWALADANSAEYGYKIVAPP